MRRRTIFALIVVTATVLLVLSFIYGVAFLFFAWWDAGLVRKLVMTFCALALAFGVLRFLQTHTIDF